MNDLVYEGILKKKFTPDDVIEAVKKFSEDNNFDYDLDESEKSITVKIMDEDISYVNFEFEGNCLIKRSIQHEVDEGRQFIKIYELLYLSKSFFKQFEVNDEFGIWADYCFYRYPKKIELRELTDEENQLLNKIDESRCKFKALQSMWGVIALYLSEQKVYEVEGASEKINWDFIRRRINNSVKLLSPIWITDAIGTWIRECMSYKKGKIDIAFGCDSSDFSKTLSKVEAIKWGFADVIFSCFGGVVNANQAIIKRNYLYYKEKLLKEGIDIEKDKYYTYRFMLSVLEYFGFEISVPYPSKIKEVDASGIDYFETVQ